MYKWFQMSSHICNLHKAANQLEIAKSLSFSRALLWAELCWETWEINLGFLWHLPHPIPFFSRGLLQSFNQAIPLFLWMLNSLGQCWSRHIQNLVTFWESFWETRYLIKSFSSVSSTWFFWLLTQTSRQHRSCLPERLCRTCQNVLEGNRKHLTLPMIWIQLLGPGFYDCSDKLPIFINTLFYEYFIFCKALVLLKAKVTVPYF